MPGLPKSIIKKYGVTKKAWAIFKGKKNNSKPNKHKKRNMSNNRPIKKRKTLAKKKKSRRSNGFLSFTTLAKFIKIGALVAPAVSSAMSPGTPYSKVENAIWKYTGYSMNRQAFEFGALAQGWMPYIATSLVTTGVSKLNGIIRRL